MAAMLGLAVGRCSGFAHTAQEVRDPPPKRAEVDGARGVDLDQWPHAERSDVGPPELLLGAELIEMTRVPLAAAKPLARERLVHPAAHLHHRAGQLPDE